MHEIFATAQRGVNIIIYFLALIGIFSIAARVRV
jgi:hypothetical protein